MKLWGGRFSKPTDKMVENFSASLPIDKRLYREDIEGSLAHAKMLGQQGIITAEETDILRGALMEIRLAIEAGDFTFDLADEDIHMAIERALIDKVGPVGGKLHTARSRNDQVATDMRLHLKRIIPDIGQAITALRKALLDLAEENRETVLPGYTHLQRAQPVFLAHHLLAYIFMLGRDANRLDACYEEADVMPLGSAALAGTVLPIDRESVARELGFSRISANSMDAVSDRDWLIQFISASAQIMVHLSRLSEELIIWSSSEFDFIEIDDSYTTGSSIMPQKKNPDVAELIRGKSARVISNMTGILTLLKGLPLTYNRDLQEDKTYMFETIDTVGDCLRVMSGMISGLKINKERMAEAAGGFTTATDYADYLVTKGVPFRKAHEVVGRLVKASIDEGKGLADFSLDELKQFDLHFESSALDLSDPKRSAASRNSAGGTGSESVSRQLEAAREMLR
jgi:argininosuccinate lyase